MDERLNRPQRDSTGELQQQPQVFIGEVLGVVKIGRTSRGRIAYFPIRINPGEEFQSRREVILNTVPDMGVNNRVKPGTAIIVTGTEHVRAWTSETGRRRTKQWITATGISFPQ